MARRSRQGAAAPAAWCALLAAALATAGSTLADAQNDKKPEASSFAPHHSRSHVYGTPVSKPIVHKRKKRKPPAAAAPAEPIK